MCVAPFKGRSTTRDIIIQGLETVVTEMLAAKIEGKIWIDGSFLSEKIDPSDVDILAELRGEFYESATIDQRQIMDAIDQNIHKAGLRVDSRSWKFYDDKGHADYWDSVWWQGFWLKHFGFYRDDGPNSYMTKGIALLILPGCDQ